MWKIVFLAQPHFFFCVALLSFFKVCSNMTLCSGKTPSSWGRIAFSIFFVLLFLSSIPFSLWRDPTVITRTGLHAFPTICWDNHLFTSSYKRAIQEELKSPLVSRVLAISGFWLSSFLFLTLWISVHFCVFHCWIKSCIHLPPVLFSSTYWFLVTNQLYPWVHVINQSKTSSGGFS